MKLDIKILGGDALEKKFREFAGTKTLETVDKVTETYARKMANEAAEAAPVDQNLLAPNIAASPERDNGLKGVWTFGSTLEYGRRQEYEHKTKKGFIRKAVWNNRTPYREAILREITKE